MIKVCHFTSAHDSFDTRIFQKECTWIAKKNEYEVYLVVQGKSRIENGVRIIGIGEKPNGRLKRMFCFSKKVYQKALELDADIYHFHDPELLWFGYKLHKKGKKVIFDSHEDTVSQIRIKPYIPKLVRRVIAKIYYVYETFICKRIDGVIYPASRNENNPFINRCKRTILLDNVPIVEDYKYDKNIEKSIDVCCTGSLTEERGISVLLKAVRKCGCSIALAGDIDSEYYNQLIDSGLLYKHEYKGMLNKSEVINLLSKTRIMVSNILNIGQYAEMDNLPTKVYEAMSMKMPVILSKLNLFEKLIDEYKFGICVDPSNVDEIADAISYLLSNNEVCVSMGENGRALVEKTYSWSHDIEMLYKLYDEIICS